MKSKESKLIICLSLIIIILCISWGFQTWKSQQGMNEYEANVNQITEINYEERQEALNQVVEEGMMNVQYTMGAVFKGTISESFCVKNSINNHYPLVFEIYNPQGLCIYASKMIEPGYEITKIQLETPLPKGIHECSIKMSYAQTGNIASVFPITIEVK